MCLDSMGADAARAFVERAAPAHPTLIDVAHLTDERFGFVNIPNSVWIDESGTIVRPAEAAWPDAGPPRQDPPARSDLPPGRVGDMMAAAAQIVSDREAYVKALHDWTERGEQSPFALSPDEVVARSGRRGVDEATAAAEFELAQHLFRQGDLAAARPHFRNAHRLQPDNWTYKRQAWSIEPSALEGPMARFWQGALPEHEDEWPYDGGWVEDASASGPASYYPRFRP